MKHPPDSLWQYCIAGEWKYCSADTAVIGANAGTPIRLVDLPQSVGIRFTRLPKSVIATIGVTPRRLAAAKRAIQRQRDKEGMFADSLQFDTPQDRIAKMDSGRLKDVPITRKREADAWREARRRLAQVPNGWRRYIIATYNCGGWPKEPVMLMEHIRKVTAEIR